MAKKKVKKKSTAKRARSGQNSRLVLAKQTGKTAEGLMSKHPAKKLTKLPGDKPLYGTYAYPSPREQPKHNFKND